MVNIDITRKALASLHDQALRFNAAGDKLKAVARITDAASIVDALDSEVNEERWLKMTWNLKLVQACDMVSA